MIRLRCSNKDFDRWLQMAREAGYRELSPWIRVRLDAEGPVATQVLRVESPAATPLIPGVRQGAEVGGQDSVQEISFEKPATWRLLTTSGLRSSAVKSVKGDPAQTKRYAKQELMNFCIENDCALGFEQAWRRMESDLADGGFSE